METLLLLILTAATLIAAAYAQYRIPFHTQGKGSQLFTRLLLLVVGLAFGYALAGTYVQATGIERLLVFLSGFGLVHVPAAIILYMKRRRGVTK